MKHSLDDTELEYPRVPWALISRSFVLFYFYIPFAMLLGLCSLEDGPSFFSQIFGLLIKLSVYSLAVHMVLVWPVSLVWERHLKGLPRTLRIYGMLCFLVPPLSSYVYFLGPFQEIMDVQELLLMVVPTLSIAALFFDRSERAWLFTAVLVLLTFIPFFVVNDILAAPTSPRWYYASTSAGFYLWRTLFPLFAVFFTLLSLAPVEKQEAADREWTLKNFAYGFLGLAGLATFLKILLPLLVALFKKEAAFEFVVWDVWPVAHLIFAFLLLRVKTDWVRKTFLYVSGLEVLTILAKLIPYLLNIETSYWKLSWLTCEVTSLFVVIWFAWTLTRAPYRELFKSGELK